MANYIVSSGEISSGIILEHGSMTVLDGGIANSTTVSYYCFMFISSGGNAISTIINYDGDLTVLSGGIVSNVTIASGGFFTVSSGGSATDVIADSGAFLRFTVAKDTFVSGTSAGSAFEIKNGYCSGYSLNNGVLTVLEDGVVDNLSINGCLVVSSGGTATNIKENGGEVYVKDGADVSFAENTFSGLIIYGVNAAATVHSGTIAEGTVVNTQEMGDHGVSAFLTVFSSGLVKDTTVNKAGKVYISSGGIANGMTICSGGSVFISSGGTMTGRIALAENANISAYKGAILDFDISELTPTTEALVNNPNFRGTPQYTLTVSEEQENGLYSLADGITMVFQCKSVILQNTTGEQLGILNLSKAVQIGGKYYLLYLSNITLSVVINDEQVFSGLVIAGTTNVVSSGEIYTDTTINYDGRLSVFSGGSVINTVVNKKGSLYVSSGGVANNTTVNGQGGFMYVSSGGVANSAIVNSDGHLRVSSGGVANNTTVNGQGFMNVSSGGLANNTTVNSGRFVVSSGGTADVVIINGGRMNVSSGGMATGKMTFEEGAAVSMYEGAILDFDLTQTSAGEDALVNDLSIIQGTPIYTLTVNGTEAEGVYTLAAGAADFAGTITVKNIYGDDLGTLKLGEKVYIGKDDYTLTLTDDVLSVAINAPTVTEANGDVLLEGAMPKARYMYGCVNTSISMILGYYDLYGYRGKDLSEVIEGDVELDTRGTGYYIYMMDDFDSVLGRANASRDYVERFFSKDPIEVINARTETETTPAEELPYSFVNDGAGPELRTDVWNCLADYLGTGQFWRGNKNLSATSPFDMLEAFLNDDTPYTVTDEATGIERTIDEKYNSCLYGLYLYVRDKGFDLDRKTTKILQADVAGGEFTFDDYRKEIDAGRPVMVLVTGHAMVGYGYNAETREIIIDNCYQSDQRMVWDGVYDFAGERTLEAICTFGFMTTDADIDLAVSPFDEDSGAAGKLIVTTAEGQLESVDYCFVGSPLYLSFAVSNQGTTASGAFDIAIYCDGVKKDNIPSLTLDPEAIRRVNDIQLAADFGVGLHSIGVRIDPDNAIQELYALNNSDARSVMVLKEGTNVVEGTKTVASGGVSKDDYVMNGAGIQVLEGGTAEGTLIQGKVTSRSLDGKEVKSTPGFVNVSRGGLIRNATVYEYGQLELSGMAEDIRVQEEGSAVVFDGGIVSGVFVDKKGALAVKSGGKLTGRIDVASDASVGFEEGGILNFDLTGTTAGAEAFVNDLSIIRGTPTYTLTVNGTEAEGVYALAEGAADFGSTISVVNTAGDKFGTLTVGGETVFVGSTGYTLNLTGSSLTVTVEVPVPLVPTNLAGTKDRVSWDPAGTEGYVVEYSTDGFAHALPVDTAGNAVDMLDLPAGTYQWRVKSDDGEAWALGDAIVSDNDTTPKVLQSNADGSDDIFFAQASGTWENLYYAQHVGSVNDWSGTNEVIFMNGRNRLADLFFGSDDANILCLTDDGNGDGIFVDDEFTDLPEGITEQQARIARIDEIRAGAGDDVVDMTSNRIEYTGDGLTVRGGDGDDVIWMNKGGNLLFGDAGNDRIVGASGNDIIAGGIGNDRMHGGGGDDIFTFCENWGVDTVEQLATGSVTLWFASGDESKWDSTSMTYTDGDNSVKVTGVSEVTLKFGANDSDMYKELVSAGAFLDFTTERIFEESGKGILASL